MNIEQIESTVNTLCNRLQDDINANKTECAAYRILADILRAKWQGKKINARLESQFKMAYFGDGSTAVVTLEKVTNYVNYLSFWTNDYSKRTRIFLGRLDNGSDALAQVEKTIAQIVAGNETRDALMMSSRDTDGLLHRLAHTIVTLNAATATMKSLLGANDNLAFVTYSDLINK